MDTPYKKRRKQKNLIDNFYYVITPPAYINIKGGVFMSNFKKLFYTLIFILILEIILIFIGHHKQQNKKIDATYNTTVNSYFYKKGGELTSSPFI